MNSASGPSRSLAEALWHADDTSGEVELLWHDRNLIGWECKTAYRWELEHRPDIGVIRYGWEDLRYNVLFLVKISV